jgi:hypothetical protein
MRFIPLYLVLALALAACGTEEPPPPDPDRAAPELQPDPDVPEPEVATRDDDDRVEEVRERRERLREEMREHRRTAEEEGVPERSPGVAEPETDWWLDDALVVELNLDEQQITAIEEAAVIRREAHDDGRRQMVELRRQLSRDLAEEGEEAGADAREQRERLRAELEAADRDWQVALEEILEPSQIEQLEAVRPDALSPQVERMLERDAEDAPDDDA